MTQGEAEIVDAIYELIEANNRARDQIDATNALLHCGIDQLVDGGGVIESLKSLPVAARRRSTQDAFQRVVKARHGLRLRAIAACAAEGMSSGEIAEIWGVSRQRVGQYISKLQKTTSSVSA
jgi:DNA-binding CsgD family transcriptional regulator